MDTNAPDAEHWWPIMAGAAPAPEWMPEEDKLTLLRPEGWEFFSQPAALLDVLDSDGRSIVGYKLNPAAENLAILDPRYYPQLVAGKTRRYIEVQVQNKLGHLDDARPVYPTFSREAHVSKMPLKATESRETIIGIDFGRTPAAVVCQREPPGRWLILREHLAINMGIRRFTIMVLRPRLAADFPHLLTGNPLRQANVMLSLEQEAERLEKWGTGGKWHGLRIYGDPAGDDAPQTDEETPFQIIWALGFTDAFPAPSNDLVLRVETVESLLGILIDGRPQLPIDPSCRTLIAGFEGRFCYRKLSTAAGAMYDNKPNSDTGSATPAGLGLPSAAGLAPRGKADN